ncbi:MAG: PAS domain S-box protein [Thaumarchaeota archaeon]|nr:PAS domain S-box protein [Nitrososphaerota archaeon]
MKKSSTKDSAVYAKYYFESLDLYRTVDLSGKIILCNKAYARTLGYSMNEVIGSSIFDHVAEKSINEMKQTFQKWRSSGFVLNHEIWLKRKNGTIFPVLLSASNIYDDKGKLIGSHTVMRDISEIYTTKEIEGIKTKRLEAIGELSARIAHDLRNPLSIIKGAIQILELTKDPALSRYSEYFSMIQRSITRMSHQVEEVLDYVKPQPLNLKTYSLLQILKDTVRRVKCYGKIKISIPKNDVKIKCDAEKLEIVFLNLILNAIQAMNNEGKINLRIKSKGTHVLVEVEDNGPGIPRDLLSKIFDPLFTTRQIGTGLGLPSCKAIIEKHGGTINVKTKKNVGTTFLIHLPKNEEI